ncbi:prefoldin [Xylariaceae sp. FL1272]|nr:prefoldin [Xylariaceae sp. FL1272]
MSAGNGGEAVNLDTLNPQQLTQVKKQLDQELEHLTSSFTQLQAAQSKFRDCLRCVSLGKTPKPPALPDNSPILVPLTNSLYVRGSLSDADHVLVDVGTGFYVEKNLQSAAQFYDHKMQEVGANIKDLEAIVQAKTTNVRVIEQVLRQKMASAPEPDTATPTS